MGKEEFLSSVLGDKGHYCLLIIKNTGSGDIVRPSFHKDRASLIEAAEKFSSEGWNCYFSVATFKDPNIGRKASNALELRSFFLDLDCGEGDKKYDNQKQALGCLREFCTETNIPKPTHIINSGNGLHIYWSLTKPCSKDEWLPVAEAFKQLCKNKNLIIDLNVPSDAARVLRIPNTYNYKNGSAFGKEVEVIKASKKAVKLKDFKAVVGTVKPKNDKKLAPPPTTPNLPMSAEDAASLAALAGDYEKNFKLLARRSGEGDGQNGCAQIRKALFHPNKLSYEEWKCSLSIAKFCDEPQAIHWVSKGYDGYTPEETEKVAAGINKPHLCSTFEESNPKGCKGCKHKGVINTPISLAMQVREASKKDNVVKIPTGEKTKKGKKVKLTKITIPKYPKPYFRGKHGGVYIKGKGEERDKLIYPFDLYLTQRLIDPNDGPLFEFRHHHPKDGVSTFTIPGVKVVSNEEFKKELIRKNVLPQATTDAVHKYLMTWIRAVQTTTTAVETKTQFGWTENYMSFVIGDKEIFADKIIPNPPCSVTEDYFPCFEKKGTLKGWKKMIKFFDQPGMEAHQLMIGLSFGAPLMEMVPNVDGCVYNLFSDGSGRGKSTGLFAAASIWGNYHELVIGQGTDNFGWHRAEIYKNIPLLIDEVTNMTPKAISDFAYMVSQGKQKGRLTKEIKERKRGGKWSFLIGTSANVSLIEKLTEYKQLPEAEQQRILELDCDELLTSTEDALSALEFNKLLDTNYGHAGIIYAQHLVKNAASIEPRVMNWQKEILTAANLRVKNRMWYSSLAVIFTGLEVAQEELGLIPFDLQNLKRWAIDQVKNIKAEGIEVEDVNVHEIIAQYYADNISSILRVHSNASRQGQKSIMVIDPSNMPKNKWVGRHEYDINKLYLGITPFSNWCTQRHLNYRGLFRKLERDMNGKKEVIKFGRGTDLNLPAMRVISVSWEDGDIDVDADIAHRIQIAAAEDIPDVLN